jgi:hypothetical protein
MKLAICKETRDLYPQKKKKLEIWVPLMCLIFISKWLSCVQWKYIPGCSSLFSFYEETWESDLPCILLYTAVAIREQWLRLLYFYIAKTRRSLETYIWHFLSDDHVTSFVGSWGWRKHWLETFQACETFGIWWHWKVYPIIFYLKQNYVEFPCH